MELIDTLIEARWIIPIVPKGVILENSALAVNAGRIVDILPFETAEKNVSSTKGLSFPDKRFAAWVRKSAFTRSHEPRPRTGCRSSFDGLAHQRDLAG